MICTANQLTGFYVRATLALNGLILKNVQKCFRLTELSVFLSQQREKELAELHKERERREELERLLATEKQHENVLEKSLIEEKEKFSTLERNFKEERMKRLEIEKRFVAKIK